MLMIAGVVSVGVEYMNARLGGGDFHYSLWSIFLGLSGFSHWLSTDLIINNPMWYISVLLFCYMIFFWVTYFARRLKILPYYMYFVCIAAGLRMQFLEALPFCNTFLSRGLICFFFGLILRRLIEKYHLADSPKFVIGAMVFLIAFVALYILRYKYVEYGLYYTLCFLVFPAIIIIFKSKVVTGLCRYVAFKEYVGGVSFNVYMWHCPMLIFSKIMISYFNIDLGKVWIMLLWTLGIYLVGTISYFVIERPIDKKLFR